jgi:hypothetical protein
MYAAGNACVDNAVERFILTGKLPAVGATMPRAGRSRPRSTSRPNQAPPPPLTEDENPLERARQLSEALTARSSS